MNDLHRAACEGCIPRTVALLARGTLDINQRCPAGYTALMGGASQGHATIVRILLNKGAETSIMTDDGLDALHLAAENGHVDVIASLVRAGADIQAKDPQEFTPLHMAAQNGHLEGTRAMLKAGAELQARSSVGATPLHVAAEEGHLDVITFLMEAGAELEATTSEGATPLHIAVSIGHVEVVAALVEGGADLQATDCEDFTYLHVAAKNGHLEVVAALMQAGADLQASIRSGDKPLHLASLNGHLEVVAALVQAGADIQATASDGRMPLHLAASIGHLEVVVVLVEGGADLHATDSEGATPLLLASVKGHSAVVKALIDAGVNPDSPLPNGLTPLALAASGGHVDVVKVLLRAEANPLLAGTDPGSDHTFVPLDAAAFRGGVEVVRELVQQLGIEGCGGASGGADALRIAAMEQRFDVMAVLVDAGVMDGGGALNTATETGSEEAVKLLLRLQEKMDSVHGATYVNSCDINGRTSLFNAIGRCSPRIVRLLVDAGADTTSAIRITDAPEGNVVSDETPLDLTIRSLHEKRGEGGEATEEQLHGLEGIRRLLLRVGAVHAVSWLWPNDIPIIDHAPKSSSGGKTTSTSLRMMLPALRRRTRRRHYVLLRALFRWVVVGKGGVRSCRCWRGRILCPLLLFFVSAPGRHPSPSLLLVGFSLLLDWSRPCLKRGVCITQPTCPNRDATILGGRLTAK